MIATVEERIAAELGVKASQVQAAVALLDEGATVPFIARYRKEVTGTLDDAQLRTLEERLRYLRELNERRAAILTEIDAQGKLTDELKAQIDAAETKARLEDLYLPYKPKRRTKAQIAREAGLEPLADLLLADPSKDPFTEAANFLDGDATGALDGARAILAERFGEDADLIGSLREQVWKRGAVQARVRDGMAEQGAKYSDYFEFDEPYTKLPSHRILALFRGEKEGVLDLGLESGDVDGAAAIADRFGIEDRGRPADEWLLGTARWAWRTRVQTHLGVDMRVRLWQAAEDEAVRVFAANVRDLLLAAPAGQRATIGLDPGFRTGVKVAVTDQTGKVVATATIYPHEPLGERRGGGWGPGSKFDESVAVLAKLAERHQAELIAIGNGTASRETDRLVSELISRHPALGLTKVVVSEAGASVYSASAYASAELPDLDVSLRGAVSIARRLQDPLAELVKIDPKSIGVGQYQHDIAEGKLSRSLDAVVEDCVNAVGVDLNTASQPLLARVSGISDSLAGAIVAARDGAGPFRTRADLMKVPRLGPKAFEQCAGFLRIRGGDDPLDASGVHPEAYPVVRRIVAATGCDGASLIGNATVLRGLKAADFTDGQFGVPTVSDILRELEKPGRDPRPSFATASFAEGVETLADLAAGMVLEGVVTNVAAFGAFVDVGVHQDGLVHVSQLAKGFVSDPRSVVKSGDVVRVRVLSVDVPRKRISLTLRLDTDDALTEGSARPASRPPRAGKKPPAEAKARPAEKTPDNNAMADALRRAGLLRDNDRRRQRLSLSRCGGHRQQCGRTVFQPAAVKRAGPRSHLPGDRPRPR